MNEMAACKRVNHRRYFYSSGSLIPSQHLCNFDAFQLSVLSVFLSVLPFVGHMHFIRLTAPVSMALSGAMPQQRTAESITNGTLDSVWSKMSIS